MNIKKMFSEGINKLKGKVPDFSKIEAGAKNTGNSYNPLGDMDQKYKRLFKKGGAAKMENKLGTTCNEYSHGGKACKSSSKSKKKK
jgi:hypothetical protein